MLVKEAVGHYLPGRCQYLPSCSQHRLGSRSQYPRYWHKLHHSPSGFQLPLQSQTRFHLTNKMKSWLCINQCKQSDIYLLLTHWGRVTHTCVSKLTIIGSDNGLSPGWRQTIIWTNAGILLIRKFGTNFSEILSEIHTCSFKKMHLKVSAVKWRPFCLGLNVS